MRRVPFLSRSPAGFLSLRGTFQRIRHQAPGPAPAELEPKIGPFASSCTGVGRGRGEAPARAAWRKDGLGRQMPLTFGRAEVSRRGTIAGGTIALAGAFALAACGADPKPEAISALAPQANTELRHLIDGAPELVVAGERVNIELLQRFYQHHGFEPVWTTRQAQANSLMN